MNTNLLISEWPIIILGQLKISLRSLIGFYYYIFVKRKKSKNNSCSVGKLIIISNLKLLTLQTEWRKRRNVPRPEIGRIVVENSCVYIHSEKMHRSQKYLLQNMKNTIFQLRFTANHLKISWCLVHTFINFEWMFIIFRFLMQHIHEWFRACIPLQSTIEFLWIFNNFHLLSKSHTRYKPFLIFC